MTDGLTNCHSSSPRTRHEYLDSPEPSPNSSNSSNNSPLKRKSDYLPWSQTTFGVFATQSPAFDDYPYEFSCKTVDGVLVNVFPQPLPFYFHSGTTPLRLESLDYTTFLDPMSNHRVGSSHHHGHRKSPRSIHDGHGTQGQSRLTADPRRLPSSPDTAGEPSSFPPNYVGDTSASTLQISQPALQAQGNLYVPTTNSWMPAPSYVQHVVPFPYNVLNNPVPAPSLQLGLNPSPGESSAAVHERVKGEEASSSHQPSRSAEGSPVQVIPSIESDGGSLYPKEGPERSNYLCKLCDRSFARKTNALDHLETHNADRERRHVCTWEGCEKAFHRQGCLKRHEDSIHLKKKDYPCSYCDMAFSRPDTQKRHEMDGCLRRPGPRKPKEPRKKKKKAGSPADTTPGASATFRLAPSEDGMTYADYMYEYEQRQAAIAENQQSSAAYVWVDENGQFIS